MIWLRIKRSFKSSFSMYLVINFLIYFTRFKSSTNSSVVKINVINAIGDLVYNKQVQADNGNNFYTLDTKEFSSGIYSVILDSNGSKAIKKLTVVK